MGFFKICQQKELWIAWSKRLEPFVTLMSKNSISRLKTHAAGSVSYPDFNLFGGSGSGSRQAKMAPVTINNEVKLNVVVYFLLILCFSCCLCVLSCFIHIQLSPFLKNFFPTLFLSQKPCSLSAPIYGMVPIHCCPMAEFWATGLKNCPVKLLAA